MKLMNWKNKSLSFTNMLQLIKSMDHRESSKGKAKVKWKDDCSLKIADIVANEEWKWPEAWRAKFLFLFHLPPPLIFFGKKDVVLWKNRSDKLRPFSVKVAWTDLSSPKPIVPCLFRGIACGGYVLVKLFWWIEQFVWDNASIHCHFPEKYVDKIKLDSEDYGIAASSW
ncbi:hypothetical protein Tco_1229169 [Tanacetum coccineum]